MSEKPPIARLSPFYDDPEGLKKMLNKTPTKQARGYEKITDNGKTIWRFKKGITRETMQISFLEKTLDLVWGQTLWRPETITKSLKENSFHNEYGVIVRLHYWHPIFHEWHFADGHGAGIIHFAKGTDRGVITNKVGNAMEAGWPRAKAFALKNAAKPLGRIFGRDVGRKFDDKESWTDMINTAEYQDFIARFIDPENLTLAEAQKAYFDLPHDIRAMPEVDKIMQGFQYELSQKALPESDPQQIEMQFDD